MTDNKLDLSVPEPGKKNRQRSGPGLYVSVLMIIIVFLCCVNTYLLVKGHGTGQQNFKSAHSAGSPGVLSPAEEREYALKLEERELYSSAAAAWENYLHSDEAGEKHTVLFRIGECLLKAGRPEEALDAFYRAEQLDTEHSLDVSDNVRSCLESLGKYTALEQELTQRTAVGQEEKKEVLASVAGENITKADLSKELETHVEMQLSSLRGKVPMDQYNRQKESIMNRYLDDPKLLRSFLEAKIKNIMLYRLSREQSISETPGERALVENLRREMIGARTLKETVLPKINITEADVQTYFRANRDEYMKKALIKVRVLKFVSQTEANAAFKEVSADKGRFFTLSEEEPLNKQLSDWIPEGSPIPQVGYDQKLQRLYEEDTPKGYILEPVLINGFWFVIQAIDKRLAQKLTFEEAKEQVARDYYMQKYSDTEKAVLGELRSKYGVKVNEKYFEKNLND